MNNTNNITKVCTYIFFLGLSLSLFYVYFAQERVYNRINFDHEVLTLGIENHIRSFSVICIFGTVILSLFDAKSKYLTKVFIAYLLILGFITINYLITGPGINDITGLMATKGIGPWIALGLIFVSFDDVRYNIFKKFLIISVVVISIYVFYNLIDYGIGLYRGQALAKYRVFATNLVWISSFVFLISKNNKKLMPIRVFSIFIGISTALITITRSFLLIYYLVLFFDFLHTRKKTFYFIGGFVIGIIFIYIIFNTESLSTSFNLLQHRGVNDTRSEQLTAFLSQMNFFETIVGKGYEATWLFRGQIYPFVDNQWLYLIWWAGLIPTLMYFYLTAVIPFKLFIKKDQDYETKVESFILILWTLACTGLAIYTTMSVEFFFFIICVIQGRILYKYSKRSEYR